MIDTAGKQNPASGLGKPGGGGLVGTNDQTHDSTKTTRGQALLQDALIYAAKDWPVIPCWWPLPDGSCACGNPKCDQVGKHPIGVLVPHGVYDATQDASTIRRYWGEYPLANIATPLGRKHGRWLLDLDGPEAFAELANHDELPICPSVTTGRGEHRYFAYPERKVKQLVTFLPKTDTRSDGGYAMLPPSLHSSGVLYSWKIPPKMANLPLAPEWLENLVCERERPAAPSPSSNGHQRQVTSNSALPERMRRYVDTVIREEQRILGQTRQPGRNDQLNKSAFALGTLAGAGLIGRWAAEDALLPIAQQIGLGDKEVEKTFNSGFEDGKQHPRDLPDMTDDAEEERQEDLHQPAPAAVDGAPVAAMDTEHLTDLGNARRLVRLYGQNMRYVEAWGWLHWDGKRFERDITGAVMRLAKKVAIGYYADAQQALDRAKKAAADMEGAQGNPAAMDAAERRLHDAQRVAGSLAKWAKDSQSRGKLENMIVLAQSEEVIAARAEAFDTSPWLLNVANGTLDLHTGHMRPHARGDLLTKVSPVAYDPSATCPRWLAFLNRIMGDNQDLVSFLQRVVGYCLTGDVSEQSLFFLHGAGQNGKSTFLKTLLAMMGRDYAMQAAADVLIAGKDRHPTELADLAGARLVASIEVEEGKRLAEALVKQLTGGDPVKARLMRQDFFQFDPTFKLLLAANHKPTIRGTDFAIWRRVKLIPFTVTITEAEKDPHLLEKLAGELPGILAWAVRGCLAWQREGLGVPAAVRSATDAYRAESDTLGAFLAECTQQGEGMQAPAGALFKDYRDWADNNGLPEQGRLTSVTFGRQLVERGFDKYTDTHTRKTFYMGLGRSQDEQK